MADDLLLPEVPEAKPDDPEDVSWALSTAEAMWARGDHAEGIKWVRKAAEAASDAENDLRALELAKAASELASLIARRSLLGNAAATTLETGTPPTMAPETTPSAPPTAARDRIEPPKAAGARTSANAPPPARSAPPPAPTRSSLPPRIPLPSKASQPPAAPRPLATGAKAQGPAPGKGVLSNRTTERRGRRRSRENLEAEARAAGVADTAPHPAVDGDRLEALPPDTTEIAALDAPAHEMPVSGGRVRRRSRPDADPTVVAHVKDLTGPTPRTTDEWDASPTQTLSGQDMDHMSGPVSVSGDRKTTLGAMPARPPTKTIHDEEIQTSQAVRVVVWRDASGVHVAPAGTVVSAITVDAVLVALEPSADLTAWLSQRDR